MNLIVQNESRMLSKRDEMPYFAKNHGHKLGLRRDFVARHGDLSRFHHR